MKKRLTVRVIWLALGLGLFYFELAPTDLCCNMLHTLLRQKKYEEEMSDKEPPVDDCLCIYALYLKFLDPIYKSCPNAQIHENRF